VRDKVIEPVGIWAQNRLASAPRLYMNAHRKNSGVYGEPQKEIPPIFTPVFSM